MEMFFAYFPVQWFVFDPYLDLMESSRCPAIMQMGFQMGLWKDLSPLSLWEVHSVKKIQIFRKEEEEEQANIIEAQKNYLKIILLLDKMFHNFL